MRTSKIPHTDLFEFTSYKQYMLWREKCWDGRGMRRALADATGCQPAYISQVFNKANDLSLEQADQCNRVFQHTSAESHFFMLLVQLARAGTSSLKSYFEEQIQSIIVSRTELKNRLNSKAKVSRQDQLVYYSNHLYALIHVALTLPALNKVDKISNRLSLPEANVRAILDFLVHSNLASEHDGTYSVGSTAVHLAVDSPLIGGHHHQWRLKAMTNLDLAIPRDMHYSSVVSFSLEDWATIRNRLLTAIHDVKNVIRESPAEDLFVFNMDLFQVKR